MTTITSRKTVPAAVTWPASAAAVWAAVFGVFHAYWAAGGRFGIGTLYDQAFQQGWFVTGDLLVVVLCAVGAGMSLATARPWGWTTPTWLLTGGMWTAAVLLVERGGFAVVQDALGHRLPAGVATSVNWWSSVAVDVYFCLGGAFFALAAWSYVRRVGGYRFAIAGAVLGSAGIGALVIFG